MIIIGVDPGVSGAVTVLDTYSYRTTYALPFTHNTLSDIFLFLSEIRGGEPLQTALSNYRAQPVVPLSRSMHKVRSTLPRHKSLVDENAKDNTMEMWLEEPGQIVVNSRIKMATKSKGKDSTRALLAGMSASRKLGRSIGQWEGIATALNISCNLVPPKRWQLRLNCKTGGDKNISKNLAISLFPFLTDKNGKSTITHDVADSLLIALYGALQYVSPSRLPTNVSRHLSTVPPIRRTK